MNQTAFIKVYEDPSKDDSSDMCLCITATVEDDAILFVVHPHGQNGNPIHYTKLFELIKIQGDKSLEVAVLSKSGALKLYLYSLLRFMLYFDGEVVEYKHIVAPPTMQAAKEYFEIMKIIRS